MINELPIYKAVINDQEEGIYTISLVDEPATEVDWVCFNKQHDAIEQYNQKFSIQDEDNHILSGVIMVPDTLIYRRNDDGFEYYIKYDRNTIALMAEKMLKDNVHNNIDIQHNGHLLPKESISLIELFIKDQEKGIAPKYLNVPDGTLCANYKIHDEEIWQLCKAGKLNGFSLEGLFSVEKQKFSKKKFITNKMLNKIKSKLAALLLEFGEIKTDNGILYYQGEEISEGTVLTDENDNVVADGEYKLEDRTVIVVADGKVAEIKEAEIEKSDDSSDAEDAEKSNDEKDNSSSDVEAELEDTNSDSEATNPEQADNATIDELKAEIEALKAEIDAIKEQVNNVINQPAVDPIAEQFEKTTKTTSNKANKAAEILKYLNA